MNKLARKRKPKGRRDPDEPTEAELRLLFELGPDDPLPEIEDATRPVMLKIRPGTKIEQIKDAKGKVIGYSLEDAEIDDVH